MTDSERISDLESRVYNLASTVLVLEASICEMEARFNALVSDAAKRAVAESLNVSARNQKRRAS